jgi:hypothetical protein
MEGVPEGNILAIARVSGTQKYLRTTDYFATIDYTLEQAFALLHHKKVIFIVRVRSPLTISHCSIRPSSTSHATSLTC